MEADTEELGEYWQSFESEGKHSWPWGSQGNLESTVLTDLAVQGLGEGRVLNCHHKNCGGSERLHLLGALQVRSKDIGLGGQAGLRSNHGSTFIYHVNSGVSINFI